MTGARQGRVVCGRIRLDVGESEEVAGERGGSLRERAHPFGRVSRAERLRFMVSLAS
jgi:hypothetical protein